MNRFAYRAIDGRGREVRGILPADTAAALCEALTAQGLTAYAAEPVSEARGLARWLDHPSQPRARIDAEALARGIATMLGAGLPMDRALDLMARTERRPGQKKWLQGLLEAVLRGQAFSAALAGSEATVPRHLVAVARAGENSGELARVLTDAAATMQRMREAREKVRSALIYPSIVLLLACAVMAVLLSVLFPALSPLFEASRAPMPLPIALSRAVGNFLSDWWPALGLLGLAGLLAATRVSRLPGFRGWRDRIVLRVPMLGALLAELELSRAARLLGLQLEHGVPMMEALKITGEAARNGCIADTLESARERVQEGRSLASGFADASVLPPLAHQLIAAGEAAGRLPQALLDLARILDAEAASRIERMLTLLAPGLTILVGGLIGLMIWSVMGAVLGVNDLAAR